MSGTYQHPLVAVVPPDAPATGLHETPWYSGDQLPVQIGV